MTPRDKPSPLPLFVVYLREDLRSDMHVRVRKMISEQFAHVPPGELARRIVDLIMEGDREIIQALNDYCDTN